uniref:Nodule Cysteine-Rich (NCR) secreted peptide n=1 Tax=Angiostrongylus cantonensis TaxID=6313 RepID=A0A0K0D4T1_ANGCA
MLKNSILIDFVIMMALVAVMARSLSYLCEDLERCLKACKGRVRMLKNSILIDFVIMMALVAVMARSLSYLCEDLERCLKACKGRIPPNRPLCDNGKCQCYTPLLDHLE